MILRAAVKSIDFYKDVVHCFDQARSLPYKAGYSTLQHYDLDAEYQSRIKLDELRVTSRDVERVAGYT